MPEGFDVLLSLVFVLEFVFVFLHDLIAKPKRTVPERVYYCLHSLFPTLSKGVTAQVCSHSSGMGFIDTKAGE